MAECVTVDDCVKIEPQLRCPERDVLIVGCFLPIARARTADFQAALSEIASELCDRVPRGCNTTPSCEYPPLVCTDGTCRAPGVYSR